MAAEPIVEGRGAAPLALEGRDSTPTVPSFLKAYATAEISSACSCLNIPTPIAVVTTSSKTTATQTETTYKTATPPVVTSTKYLM